MISFFTTIKKFSKKGEKTGWTYVEIPVDEAQKINPGNKRSFRVKGYLDEVKISQAALIPMGEGNFILPLNKELRKGTGKNEGDELNIRIETDKSEIEISPDLLECLADEPKALANFNKLAYHHRNYFSKWILSAKTFETKSKRIAMAVNAILNNKDYGQMIRDQKDKH
ncbi:MAG TPA: YdeI/OmpD-associated family protein [Ignavibacteria bacterium]|nr:YdeI/OmpD-associated family protein [Ignavibacteria bacterium]HMR41194.1 YdeI/OmpD-associated family protein [Ignavibacteria bacterium]